MVAWGWNAVSTFHCGLKQEILLESGTPRKYFLLGQQILGLKAIASFHKYSQIKLELGKTKNQTTTCNSKNPQMKLAPKTRQAIV